MEKPYVNAAKILAVLFGVATSAYCATGQDPVKLQADDEKVIRKLVAANGGSAVNRRCPHFNLLELLAIF